MAERQKRQQIKMTRNGKTAMLVVAAVIIIDQASKIWVKTHFALGDEINVIGEWFRLHFVENNGMAFGMQLSGESWGKLALSVFRIVAIVFICIGLARLCRQEEKRGLVACISLVLAGAVGNIFDSVFYGLIFDSSWGQVATLFPAEGGYGTLLHGRVVDMLYFPLIEGHWPEWVPVWGGQSFLFFRPVFNIADSAICVGMFLMIVFFHKYLGDFLAQVFPDKKGGASKEAEQGE